MKNQIAESKTSVTKFVAILFTGDKKDPLPPTPIINLGSPALPAKPGIEKRTKEFTEYLELQDDFTKAIGPDLGFYAEASDSVSPEERTADFKVKDFSGYRLDVFSLQGLDAFKLSYRVKGATAWTNETLTSSPYTLEIPPDGLAVTLEMQGILIKNNKPIGQMSDMKTVVAHA